MSETLLNITYVVCFVAVCLVAGVFALMLFDIIRAILRDKGSFGHRKWWEF